MDKNEFYKFEDRAYIQPTLSSGEQEAFINNLRDIQKKNNAEIQEQTYDLGTEVPSNLGGLGGGESYFSSRYQTPQVTEMVNSLQAAAQAQALSDVMTNYQNQLQNQYKQAYRKAQERQRARQNSYLRSLYGGGSGGNSGGGNNGGNNGNDKLNINTVTDQINAFDDFNSKLFGALGGKVTGLLSKINSVTGNERLQQLGNGVWKDTKTGYTLTRPSGTFMEYSQSGLKLWPNGKRVTSGSTYTQGKNTYIAIPDSKGNVSVFQIKK